MLTNSSKHPFQQRLAQNILQKRKSWKATKRGENAGWREIAGTLYYFRSRWEAHYARYLEWLRVNKLITEWLHEPKFFDFPIKHGVTRYLPDFQVIELSGVSTWIEVKGFMDSKSKTKIARFKKYYPNERLMVVDSKWFSHNNRQFKGIVPGWE